MVGHTHEAFELRAGKRRILNPGACCSKTYAFKQSGASVEPAGYRPATFGVLELPSKRLAIGDSKGVFERLRTLPGRIRSAPITFAQRT